jgi:hypothetical protein
VAIRSDCDFVLGSGLQVLGRLSLEFLGFPAGFAMIVGERKGSEFVLVLVIALLVGAFIVVVWFHRKETPTPRKPPRQSASLLPDKPNREDELLKHSHPLSFLSL